jgi:hypothetical protein
MSVKTFSPVSAVVLALAIASSLSGVPQAASPELIVPSQMCGNYFLIPLEVDLDGDGQSTTLMALFDTGGAGLHIDPDAVVRSGGAPVEERKQITIRNATAGPLTFRKLRPYTRHLDHLSRPIGIQVDIFLPFRSFKGYLLTLDFPRREIRVARGQLPQPDGVEIFNARGPDRRPYLDTEIAGRTHRLLIDSGSSGSISLQPGRELSWLSPPLPVSVGQGMEKLFYFDVGRLDADIDIAGVKITQPLVKIGAITELIGTDVMRRFAWTFDQSSRRVRIHSDSSDPLRLPPKRGTGAILIPTPEGFEIARVLAGTPAERAGLLPGDVVVAVDGDRVLERDCDRWKEEHLTETTLTLLRDGETFDRRVELIDIVP